MYYERLTLAVVIYYCKHNYYTTYCNPVSFMCVFVYFVVLHFDTVKYFLKTLYINGNIRVVLKIATDCVNDLNVICIVT